MKIISFDGRVGANGVEVKTTKTGISYATFSVANNSFTNGNEETEWFDVTSFDPNFIEKRAKNITKGTYVIINGQLRTKMNVDRSGKVWINQYVTANTIDTPRFGVKNENVSSQNTTNDPVVSTYTGGTPNIVTETAPEYVAHNTPSMQPVTVGSNGVEIENDDLPF